MVVHKELEIKNCPAFIFGVMVNMEDIDLSAIGVNEISSVDYEIEYYHNIAYDNPLYLIINDVDAYFLSINEEKYLIFDPTDKNKDILEYYKILWDTITGEISNIRDIEKVKLFDIKDLVIRFKSNDKIPLGKIVNIPVSVLIIKSLFKIDTMFYPEIYLHSCYLEFEEIP